MTSVIYCITNIVNDKQYVGQAINRDKRLRDHRIMLNAGKHQNRHLQSAYNKYGKENFIYTILEIVPSGPDLKDRLTTSEQYWMDRLNTVTPNGYNLNPTAATAIGFKHSDETKKAWSEQRKGQKRSGEALINLREGQKKRGPVSEEARLRMSISHIGKTQSDETKAKRAVSMTGNTNNVGKKRSKPTSPETRARISEANKAAHKRRREAKAALDNA